MPKFVRREKSSLRFCPAVANTAAPTRSEINAGTLLDAQLQNIEGMDVQSGLVEIPTLASKFTAKIPGSDQLGDPTLTFYDEDDSTTVRTALARDTNGFLIRFPYGDVATKRCEVWKVQSTGVNDQWTIADEPALFNVSLAPTAVPNLGAVVPA